MNSKPTSTSPSAAHTHTHTHAKEPYLRVELVVQLCDPIGQFVQHLAHHLALDGMGGKCLGVKLLLQQRLERL